MTETKSLAEALAALQAHLPEIKKSSEANVPTKSGGSYSYNYADLAQISRILMPVLGSFGLSFTAKPTLVDGQFVLAYRLLHVSGESDDGLYPLPSSASPQAVGSAITYARRYCLCAVTGVAPEDDDDGAAAQAEWQHAPAARPEPITDWAWADGFETRVAAVTKVDALRTLWDEMVAKHKAGKLTDSDRATFEQVVNLRKSELEGSPA